LPPSVHPAWTTFGRLALSCGFAACALAGCFVHALVPARDGRPAQEPAAAPERQQVERAVVQGRRRGGEQGPGASETCYDRPVDTLTPVPPGEHVPTADQRLVSYNVPWEHFEVQLALRGDRPVPRMAYLQGALELVTPSRDHERIKSYIGRLVEAYALERGIDLSPYGAWMLKNAPKESAAEPDECYIVGADQQRDTPDLAIEVTWTSGGIDKLEIYRRLGIGEVWFWREGRIGVWVLRESGYERAERSGLFPDLDLELLCSLVDRPTALQAVKALRERLKAEG
jgi:Uma2 family endonuclease